MEQEDQMEVEQIENFQMEEEKQKQVIKQISYGSIAFFLGKKADTTASHKWYAFVRGRQNEDISNFVSKVTFTLHPSFDNPVREVTSPPFEIREFGWGQFDIVIKISFHDPSFKDVEIVHLLKLHPNQNTGNQSIRKPVLSEFYDEIVFTNPSDSFFERIQQNQIIQQNVMDIIKQEEDDKSLLEHEIQVTQKFQEKNYLQYLNNFDTTQHTGQLQDALSYINFELQEYKQKISFLDKQISKLRETQQSFS